MEYQPRSLGGSEKAWLRWIGEAVRDAREDRGYNQEELGLLIGFELFSHNLYSMRAAYEILGMRMAQFRQRNNINRTQFSQIFEQRALGLCLTQDRISRIEQGKSTISAVELFMFCSLFQQDIQTFNPLVEDDLAIVKVIPNPGRKVRVSPSSNSGQLDLFNLE